MSKSSALKNTTDSYEGDTMHSTWNASISVQPELMKQCKDSQICSLRVYRMTTSKTSTSVGDHAQLSVSDMPSDMILEGLCKSKLQGSVQLLTVLASFDQETVRNNGQPSYSRNQSSVRLHIDQTMKTRNF